MPRSVELSFGVLSAMAIGISSLLLPATPGVAAERGVTNGLKGPLVGVSCVSEKFCTAVGPGLFGTDAPSVAEMWNGTKWRPTALNLPAHATAAQLNSVSCTSSTNCWAVGAYAPPGGKTADIPFAEHWGGDHWSAVKLPESVPGWFDELYGVSCATASRCLAVGQWSPDVYAEDGRPVAESWNGRTWTESKPPAPTGSRLESVSCTSAANCMAVGGTDPDGIGATLVEQWNGKGWKRLAAAPPKHNAYSALTGVSCPSPRACVAVGWSAAQFDGEADSPLAEVWNGKNWSGRILSPGKHLLLAVSCASATYCLFVGGLGHVSLRNGDVNYGQPYAGVWNGSALKQLKAPVPNGGKAGDNTGSQFNGVSCLAAKTCAAVGAVYASQSEDGVSAFWNWKTWRLAPTV